MLKKAYAASLVAAVAAGAILVGSPAFAGKPPAVGDELLLQPCGAGFQLAGVNIPMKNGVQC